MGITKSEVFTPEQNQLAAWAKAFAHPARIAILQFLLTQSSCVCGDIVDELPLAQSTVSQHLKALKDAGIIQGSIEGSERCYCINLETWQQVSTGLNILFGQMKPIDSCC